MPKPESETIDVVAEPSKVQHKLIKNLGKRAARIRNGNVDPREDNMLRIIGSKRGKELNFTQIRKVCIMQMFSNCEFISPYDH